MSYPLRPRPPSDEPAEYQFTESGDGVDGSTATGRVWGVMDSYRSSGEITDFRASRDVPVVVDGRTVDPEDIPGGTGDE